MIKLTSTVASSLTEQNVKSLQSALKCIYESSNYGPYIIDAFAVVKYAKVFNLNPDDFFDFPVSEIGERYAAALRDHLDAVDSVAKTVTLDEGIESLTERYVHAHTSAMSRLTDDHFCAEDFENSVSAFLDEHGVDVCWNAD